MTSTVLKTDLRVHALGAVRVTRDGAEVRLGGPRQRRLLAVLLIHHGAVASVDRVAEAVFAGEPTVAAATTLRSYVARLRRVLGEDAVLTRAPGYQLALPVDAVDVTAFEAGIQQARTALQRQDPVTAAELARSAMELWAGEAYAEFADEQWAYAESQRLAELRLTARELLAEARLACGHTAEVLPTLEALRTEHPLREGLRGLLMTAYYRAGRQADALAEFRGFREELADELGIDPSPALVELQRRILAQDASLEADVELELLRGYVLGERLGTGRDGTVHAAELPGVDRPLVVKTIRSEIADDQDFVRAFAATAHRVASLRHPAVVPIHDYWREPGAAYVVMERIGGGTLRDRLRRGPLSSDDLRLLVERVGGALLAAADAGLVHGRVDTTAVLYDGDEPFLTDFQLGSPRPPAPGADVRAFEELLRTATGAPNSMPGNSQLDEVLTGAGSLEELVVGLLEALGEQDREPVARANPYQGLRAFDEADQDFYFGRTELVEDVVERLMTGARLVLLVGASGTGKSSAVRAGLLPVLRVGERSREWFVATMLPAGAPYAELAEALNRIAVAPTTGLADRMASDGDGGIDAALRDVVPNGGQLLLVVDQFEELFTLSPEQEQRAFLAALSHALAAPESRLRMVATLRADYFDRPLAVQPFGSLVADATVPIPAMLPAEVEAAVVEPARRVGRSVERALAAELVGVLAAEPAALPALQFVLFELAERCPDGALTLDAYHELGGLEGAIAERAEELYQSLDDVERRQVRELFERLVVVGDGEPTRRRATRDELGDAGGIVDDWAEARLLTLDVHPQTRMPTVEVAHEALVREWPRLRDWIEADRNELVVLGRVRESARAWAELDRDSSALLRGTALAAALDVVGRRTHVPAVDQEYVEASRVAAERERVRQGVVIRRLRLQVTGIAVVLVLAVVGGFVALDQRREAVAQRHNATARELAAAANESLRDDPERSILLALAAVEETRRGGDRVLPEAHEALHRAVSSNRIVRSFREEGGALDWSRDGKYFATEGSEKSGMLTIRDAQTGKALRRWRAETTDINDVAFSPDSRRIASVGDDGAIRVWDVDTGKQVSEAGGPATALFGLSYTFGRHGELVAASLVEKNEVRVVDAQTGSVVATFAVEGPAGTAFGLEGQRLVVTEQWRDRAVVYDIRSRRQVMVLTDVPAPVDVAWRSDDKWIAVASMANHAIVFNADTGERRFETIGNSGPVNAVAWSQWGLLATGSDDGTVRVYGLGHRDASLLEFLVLSGQAFRDGVRSVAFDPEGEELMAAPWTISGVKVWDISLTGGGEVGSFVGGVQTDRAAVFTPDSRSVWVAGVHGSVARYDIASGEDVQNIPASPTRALDQQRLLLSPDGDLLAVAPSEGVFPVFDAASEQIAFEVDVRGEIADAAWSPDGEYFAVAVNAEVGRVYIFDRSGNEVSHWTEHNGHFNGHFFESVAFVADGDRLATTGGRHSGQTEERVLAIWDWREGELVRRIEANVQNLAAAPVGDLVATNRFIEGVADVWDVSSGKHVAVLEGHTGLVTGIAFDASAERVATASVDGSARVWDSRTGDVLSALRGPVPVGSGGVAFSPDGRRLVTTWEDGISRVWTLDIDELVQIARKRLTRELTPAECKQYLHTDTCAR